MAIRSASLRAFVGGFLCIFGAAIWGLTRLEQRAAAREGAMGRDAGAAN